MIFRAVMLCTMLLAAIQTRLPESMKGNLRSNSKAQGWVGVAVAGASVGKRCNDLTGKPESSSRAQSNDAPVHSYSPTSCPILRRPRDGRGGDRNATGVRAKPARQDVEGAIIADNVAGLSDPRPSFVWSAAHCEVTQRTKLGPHHHIVKLWIADVAAHATLLFLSPTTAL